MNRELSNAVALRTSGFDPDTAEVLAISTVEDMGLVLIAPRPGHDHHEVAHLAHDGDRWTALSCSRGATSVPVGPLRWGDTPASQTIARVVYAYGRSTRPGLQAINWDGLDDYLPPGQDDWWVGRSLQVSATAAGWWVWLARLPARAA